MHVAAPASVHWPSGSCPVGTLLHVPSMPASAHDRQVPVQLLAQQTFCEQAPLAQSVLRVQAWPFGFLVHTPTLHTLGGLQSPSTVQVVLQAVGPQT